MASHQQTVYINGRFLSQRLTGVQRSAMEMVKAIDALIARNISEQGRLYILLIPPNASPRVQYKRIQVRQVGRFSGHLWEQIELPWYAREGVLLSLCNLGAVLHRRQVVTMHDAQVLATPKNYSFLFRSYYKLMLPLLGRFSRAITTVSEFSKRQLIKFRIAPPEKIRVIHNGADHINAVEPDWTVIERHGLAPHQYVLCVGSPSRNKNLKQVFGVNDWLHEQGIRLVVAGEGDTAVFGMTSKPLPANVAFVGSVTDQELRALYQEAICLVFPSLYEGFGLPPVEAMACGCPVISSDAAALPEICGSAALYFSPGNADALVSLVRRLTENPELASAMRAAGRERVKRYVWQTSARHMLDLAETVAS